MDFVALSVALGWLGRKILDGDCFFLAEESNSLFWREGNPPGSHDGPRRVSGNASGSRNGGGAGGRAPAMETHRGASGPARPDAARHALVPGLSLVRSTSRPVAVSARVDATCATNISERSSPRRHALTGRLIGDDGRARRPRYRSRSSLPGWITWRSLHLPDLCRVTGRMRGELQKKLVDVACRAGRPVPRVHA
jgi:hypothetical protein